MTKRFGNLICFRPEVGGGETPTQLGPLEGANRNHWACDSFFIIPALFLDDPVHEST
jgi:hypothetical protein